MTKQDFAIKALVPIILGVARAFLDKMEGGTSTHRLCVTTRLLTSGRRNRPQRTLFQTLLTEPMSLQIVSAMQLLAFARPL